MNKDRRLEQIDMLKGIAIISITFLHLEAGVIPNWLNEWFGQFMISAFYFVSGWLFVNVKTIGDVWEFAKKRFRSLGIPYMWFTLLILSFDLVWCSFGFIEWRTLYVHVFNAFSLRGIGTLWFLPCLYFAELFFLFLLRKKNPLLIGGSIIFTCLYLYLYHDWKLQYRETGDLFRVIDAPFSIVARILSAWPIILSGYVLNKVCGSLLLSRPKWELSVAGLVFVLGSLCCFMFEIDLGGVFAWISNPVIISASLLIIFSGYNLPVISRLLKFWGKNSLVLMATHYSIFQVIVLTVCERVFDINHFYGWTTVLAFVVVMLVEYPTVLLFRSKLSFMMGK
ncbi:MAG: acyltransferase family protein [Akkermansia sp.]|nr:acyltransferase family protein [Akkermansia sp.]